jgi:glutamate/aspartate transport system substrate-binding protein
MMDDALLAGERAKAKKPDNWEIVGKPISGSLRLHAA